MEEAVYSRRRQVIERLKDRQASLEASGEYRNAGFMRLAIDVLELRNSWLARLNDERRAEA